jgi:hypothetical protein
LPDRLDPSALVAALRRHGLEDLTAREIADLTTIANGEREIEAGVS